MENQQYLGIINLSGIHEFVGESRKLVELHYGSRMANESMRQIIFALSKDSKEINELMRELREEIQELINIEEFIIPPQSPNYIDDNDYNYPNQLLFRFSGKPETNKIEDALRNFLKEYFREKGKNSLKKLENFQDFDDLWLKQWEDSLPIFYTSVKIYDNDFPKHHQTLQKKLISHKLNRRFEQWQAGVPISKCIQCGHREVAGPSQTEKDNKQFWDNNLNRLIAQGKLKVNERLCPVCLGKRILAMTDPEREKIPTTTFMAALPFFEKLDEIMRDNKDKKKEEKWSIFYKKIKEINQCLNDNFSDKFREIIAFSDLTKLENKSNAEWFYEDFYAIKDFKNICKPECEEKINDLLDQERIALKALLKEIGIQPSKYIALIEYDGDKMGEKRGKLDLDELKDLSAKISNFSRTEIKKIFKDNKRFLIYSGGEDVLGFSSMSEALKLINEINDTFVKNMNHTGERYFTGSGSITFFRHDFPLQEALKISDKNLQIAKEDFGRDSLVIGWILPDSSQYIFGSKWKGPFSGNFTYSIYNLLMESIEWFTKGKKIKDENFSVSRGFLYDVLEILIVFYEEKSGRLISTTTDALEKELVRLMMRHIKEKIKKNAKPFVKKACEEYIDIVKRVILQEYSLNDIKFGLTNMEAFFKLIDFYVSRVEG